MASPRVKIFTRSFDLRLYRLSSALFKDIKDPEGNSLPCVRLTDQSADGYFFTILKDKECDIAINIDEDAFIISPEAVTDLIGLLEREGYANIGYSDGDKATTHRNAVVTNPFFNVLDLRQIRNRLDRSSLKRELDDAEPYYPLFKWMAGEFKTLYLPCEKHRDGTTTTGKEPEGRTVCLHTWFSRFYSMPDWMVRFADKRSGNQKERIDAIIKEAYDMRGISLPKFSVYDRITFAADKTARWMIKVPQRISRWPYKIKRKICRKFQS